MNTLFKTAALSVVTVVCVMLTGCGLYEYKIQQEKLGASMHFPTSASTPPISLGYAMWKKPNASVDEVKAAGQECDQQIQNNKELRARPFKDIADHSSICMLQQGFKFVPTPDQMRGLCHLDGVFWNGVACKSVRGEYQLATPGKQLGQTPIKLNATN